VTAVCLHQAATGSMHCQSCCPAPHTASGICRAVMAHLEGTTVGARAEAMQQVQATWHALLLRCASRVTNVTCQLVLPSRPACPPSCTCCAHNLPQHM
jgi:hypothetical protein